MRNFILVILFFVGHIATIFAQTLVAERTAELVPGLYSISGTALFHEFDTGASQLILSSDFSTPPGPDVRILLGNTIGLSNTVEIANLTGIGHFSGGITFDIPSGVDIDDFQFILFYCVQFQQFWASGAFGATTTFETTNCQENTVALGNGLNTVDICPSDGVDNIVNFSNSLSTAAGENYAYLITDENEVLQEVVLNGFYNFEGSDNEVQRVYGLSYEGQLSPVLGANRNQTTAEDCFIHSESTTFATITKDGCAANYECLETITATTNWGIEVVICPTDGDADEVVLKNNLFIPAGLNYAYLITDENQIVEQVVLDTLYDFENSGMATQRIYGVNYDGMLNVAMGQHRSMTTASGCFIHSGDNIFLTILKTGCASMECVESAVATHNWGIFEDICTTDGEADEVFIQNNVSENTILGENYAFLLTDANELLQEVIFDSTYDFASTGVEEQRVYGISYNGDLDSKIGETRKNTTASNCFIHSDDNLFLTINKTSACATAVNDPVLSSLVKIFPNPATESVTIEWPATFIPEEILLLNMLGSKVAISSLLNANATQLQVQHLNTGTYIVRIKNKEQVVNRMIQIVR